MRRIILLIGIMSYRRRATSAHELLPVVCEATGQPWSERTIIRDLVLLESIGIVERQGAHREYGKPDCWLFIGFGTLAKAFEK